MAVLSSGDYRADILRADAPLPRGRPGQGQVKPDLCRDPA